MFLPKRKLIEGDGSVCGTYSYTWCIARRVTLWTAYQWRGRASHPTHLSLEVGPQKPLDDDDCQAMCHRGCMQDNVNVRAVTTAAAVNTPTLSFARVRGFNDLGLQQR